MGWKFRGNVLSQSYGMMLRKNLPIPIKILSKNPLMDFPPKNSMDPNPPDFQPISIYVLTPFQT